MATEQTTIGGTGGIRTRDLHRDRVALLAWLSYDSKMALPACDVSPSGREHRRAEKHASIPVPETDEHCAPKGPSCAALLVVVELRPTLRHMEAVSFCAGVAPALMMVVCRVLAVNWTHVAGP